MLLLCVLQHNKIYLHIIQIRYNNTVVILASKMMQCICYVRSISISFYKFLPISESILLYYVDKYKALQYNNTQKYERDTPVYEVCHVLYKSLDIAQLYDLHSSIQSSIDEITLATISK